MLQKSPSTVFITGGNEGIGYTFCTQLLAKGFHLIVVDVLVMHLEKLQKKFPEKIEIFQLDLCDIPAVRALFKKLPIAKIDYVINNAGINNFSWFHQSDLDYNLQMMRLNVEAVVVLTQLFTQAFVKRDHGRILNLSSIASLQPMPMWQVYAGSKVFIRNFSVAVNLELKIKKSQVRVLTLCPPVIRTRMYRKIAQSNSYRDKDWINHFPHHLSAEKLCAGALKKLLSHSNRNVISVGCFYFFGCLMAHLLPIAWNARINFWLNRKFFKNIL